MTLKPFLNCHLGATAWLFGKGASFDRYLQSADYQAPDPGIVTMAVNEAALIVPNPTYFFAHDLPIVERIFNPEKFIFGKPGSEKIDWRVSHTYPAGTIAILQKGHEVVAEQNGIAKERVFCYRKAQHDTELLKLPVEKLAETGALYGQSSTIQSACHFAKLTGCKEVVLVGVDGGDGIAQVFEPMSCFKGSWYTKNRGDTQRILQTMGMPFRLWVV